MLMATAGYSKNDDDRRQKLRAILSVSANPDDGFLVSDDFEYISLDISGKPAENMPIILAAIGKFERSHLGMEIMSFQILGNAGAYSSPAYTDGIIIHYRKIK